MLLLLIVATIVFIRCAGVDRYVTFKNLQENKVRLLQAVENNYFLSVAGYIVLYIAVVAFSIPGATVLTLSGGFLFGALLGTLYVNAGATTGATLAFLFCRYAAGDWIQEKYLDKLITFNKELSENGYRYLLALRLIPLFPFFLINAGAGLTNIPLRTFVWTTSMGILPGSFVYAFAGKQLGSIKSMGDIFSTEILIAFSLLALLVLVPVVVKYSKRKRTE
jgi:uncharacterized membrane protein YdjX (TVP38/TMEM64 family)